MDSGNGTFREVSPSEYKELSKNSVNGRIDKVFSTGEIIEVNGSKFKIRSIDNFSGIMTLKLLKNGDPS